MGSRPRLPTTAVAVAALAAAGLTGAPAGHAGASPCAPPARSARHDLQPQLRHLSTVLPLARDLSNRAIPAQSRRLVELLARGWLLRVPGPGQHVAGLASARRVSHRPRRQVLERVRRARSA